MCKKRNLEYMFFNPIEKKLYDSNFCPVDKIKISDKSDLDLDTKINPYLIFKSIDIIDKNLLSDEEFKILDENEANFLTNINTYIKKLVNKQSSEFFREILNELKLIKSMKIIAFIKCKILLFPRKSFGYFIKSKSNGFLLCYNNNDCIFYYDCFNKSIIKQDDFFSCKCDNELIIIKLIYRE